MTYKARAHFVKGILEVKPSKLNNFKLGSQTTQQLTFNQLSSAAPDRNVIHLEALIKAQKVRLE